MEQQHPRLEGGKSTCQLHQADRPWLPRHRCRGEEAGRGGDFTGKFRSVLNKVTLQTLETLAQQALGLKVESANSLEAMVELLHTQAIAAPVGFIPVFAHLAKALSPLEVEKKVELHGESTPPTAISFADVLVNRARQTFEQHAALDAIAKELTFSAENASTSGERRKLQFQLENYRWKRRKDAVGNVCFIGQLFKLKLISEVMIRECLDSLLAARSDEEQLECFTYLVAVVGEDFSHRQSVAVNGYLLRVAELVREERLSKRIRFRLMDIQDMRASDWKLHPHWLGESPQRIYSKKAN